MKVFLFLVVVCFVCCDRIKLRQYAADINPMSEDAHYQFTTSSYETTFMVMFKGVCIDHTYKILFEYLGTNETVEFTENLAMFFKYPGMEGYQTLTEYNFTIFKGDFTPCAVGIIFSEYFPEEDDKEVFVLSDNETSTYSDETSEETVKYYRYYLPYKSVHLSKATYIGIKPLTEENPITGIYVSLTQYPDITNDKTYQYKLTEFKYNEWNYIKIDGNGDLPYYDGCIYYITVGINKGSEFAIKPSYERDPIELKQNVDNDLIVSPWSSTYGEIKLPKQSERNTVINIDISFGIEKPFDDDSSAGLAVFISNESPYINPANAVWTKYEPIGESIHFEITSEDGKFCDDCSYYIRIDGARDIQYAINTKVKYTITHEIVPVRIKPDTRMHGYFHGISLQEHRDVFLYIPSEYNNETSGKIDAIQISVQYDEFSEETADLLISNRYGDNQLPAGCVEKTWYFENISSTLNYYIPREDEGFCTGIELLISLNLTKADGHEFNYIIFGHYEEGLRIINDGESINNQLVPWTEGMFYAINMTAIDLDTDVIVHLQPHVNTMISVYVSKTSFKDGDMTPEWAMNCSINGRNQLLLKHDDPNWKMTGLMYIRVDHTFDDDTAKKNYTIDIRSKTPLSNELQIDGNTKTVYENVKVNRTSYLYFTLNSQDITSVQSYSFNFTSLTNSGITELYLSNTTYPKPHLGKYNYRIVMRSNPFTFDITRDQQGFCEKCVLYFAVKIPANEEAKFNFVGDINGYAEEIKYDKSITGSIKENSGAIAYKFGLTSLDAVNGKHPEVKIHFGKSVDSSNLIIGINPKKFVSNPKDAVWQGFTLDNLNVTITINDQAEEYCIGCNYYISVGFHSAIEIKDSVYEISLLCPNNDCNSCNDPHFTPESDCKECIADYYGKDCSNMCDCNHGKCNSGISGDGKCTCDAGWDEPKCNKCKANYFGVQCELCTIDCHGRGVCNDGAEGDGTCKCETGFDTKVDCSSCISGVFGSDCTSECPGGLSNPCNRNGRCNDGINGNGRCLCLNGYYGLDCRAVATNTTCHPFCVEGNGACDEDNGVCFCFDGNFGETCSNKQSNSLSGGAIAGIVIACVIVVFVLSAVFLYYRRKPRERSRSFKGHSKNDKNVLLENRASLVGAINV